MLDRLRLLATELGVDLQSSWPRWVLVEEGGPQKAWNLAKGAPLRPLPFAASIADLELFAAFAQFTFGAPEWLARSDEERAVCRRDFERSMHEINSFVARVTPPERDRARSPLNTAWQLYIEPGKPEAEKRLAHLKAFPALHELLQAELRESLAAVGEAQELDAAVRRKRPRSKSPKGGGSGRPRADDC